MSDNTEFIAVVRPEPRNHDRLVTVVLLSALGVCAALTGLSVGLALLS